MGQQHKRRRKRLFYRKESIVNLILGVIAVILIFVWGGLHLKDSSDKKLLASQKEQDLAVQLQQPETQTPSVGTDTEAVPTDAVEPDAEQGQQGPAVTPEPAEEEAAAAPEETVEPVQPVQPETNKPEAKPETPVQTNKPVQQAAKPKPKPSNTPAAVKPAPVKTPEPATPSPTPTVDYEQIYGQQIIELQVRCTENMNAVITGAETSFAQVDQSDAIAVAALNEKLTKELETAEAACNVEFAEITGNAEKDGVSTKVIEGWSNTFIALKDKLRVEFETKLLQMLGA